jgi:hypothetical protein
MNIIDETALAGWAAERKLTIQVARAIFEVADGDDDAQRIFENPTPCEALTVLVYALEPMT